MKQLSRYAGVARPVQEPERYGWWGLLLPVILALELGFLVVLAGRLPG